MIYLASPYKHPNELIQQLRYDLVCTVAAQLMKTGEMVFAPIAHSHSVAIHGELPKDWAYWKAQDTWYLERCDKLVVCMIAGWNESEGVTAEIKIAKELGKPVEFIAAPTTCAVSTRQQPDAFLQLVLDERERQLAKWGEQNHVPSLWATILGEEFGEVCKAALEGDRPGYLTELVQVAAVAMAMYMCASRKGAEWAASTDLQQEVAALKAELRRRADPQL